MPVSIPNAPGPGNYIEDFFIYETTVTNLAAAGGNIQNVIAVQADSDFKLIKLAHFSNNHASITNQTESTRVLPLVTVQIIDTGSGRQLFNAPVPIPAFMGDGRVPFILPIIRIFKARTSIQINFVNYDTAIAYDIYFALIGTKMFPMGATPALAATS